MKSVSIAVREDAVAPLDRWLATELEQHLGRPVPRSLCRKAIASGLVAVAGRETRDPGYRVTRGRSVFVRTLDWLPEARVVASPTVLFEDEWLLALDKPAGLPTHETADPTRASLTAFAERHVGRRVFVHHRLDAETSGCVLFAKKTEANAGLAAAFAGREVEKIYIALVEAPATEWPTDFTIDTPLTVQPNGRVSTGPGGDSAQTRIRVIRREVDRLVVEVRPVTGRKHQIRAHLASMGAPVCGDVRYGGKRAIRLMLHAREIVLAHPVTGLRLRLSSALPAGFDLVRSPAPPAERTTARDRSRPPAGVEVPARSPADSGAGDGSRRQRAGHTAGKPRSRGREQGRGSRR